MKILIAFERSGVLRRAWRDAGFNAWSCDLLPADDNSKFHIQGDALKAARGKWALMIAHPECTALTNAGVRWLYQDGRRWRDDGTENKLNAERWLQMYEAICIYKTVEAAPIPRICIENSIMHPYAKAIIGPATQIIQPWMFGSPYTKGAHLRLKSLPKLKATHDKPARVIPKCHFASPGPDRARQRSETEPEVAAAMVEQWGRLL